MKISKTSWTLLTVGILVITFGSLGISRSQQLHEANQLSDNLSVAKSRLSKLDVNTLYSQQDKLNTKISELSTQLQANKSKLTQPNDSITVIDSLFRMAAASGVEVTQIGSSGLGPKSLERVGATAITLQTVVKGEMSNLIDFVLRLNKDFVTGVINSGQIVVRGTIATANMTDITAGTASGSNDNVIIVTDNTTGASDTKSSAQIQVTIYAYQGN